MLRLRIIVTVGIAAAATLGARSALAFCWASTCQPNGVVCEVPSDLDCGSPLFWARECVGYSIQRDATTSLSYQEAASAVSAGFHAWLQPFCNGQMPGIGLVPLQDVECGAVEYNSTAGNANIVVFRDEAWTHPDSPDKIALTTVTFNPDTGEIYDVDVEVNSALHLFTTGDTDVAYDLESIMAHEAGHFYGMGHSLDWDATMFETYEPGSLEERTLTPDDQRGMCAMYPPWPIDREACNPIPRHGFASECESEQPEHGCSIGRGPSPPEWLLVVAVGIMVARRRVRVRVNRGAWCDRASRSRRRA